MTTTNDNDDLSNSAIALLFAIGNFDGEGASAEQKTHLEELITGGYVAVNDDPESDELYKLTHKANQFLSERGAGANES